MKVVPATRVRSGNRLPDAAGRDQNGVIEGIS